MVFSPRNLDFWSIFQQRTRAKAHREMQRESRFVMVGAFTALALVMAACGSSSQGSSTSSTKAGNSGSTATTSATADSTHLKTYLDSLSKIPVFKAPGPSLNATKLSGSKLVAVDCAPFAPPPAQTTAAVVAAGKAAGLDVTVLAGGNQNISADIQFIDQGISLKPIAIVLVGCAPPLLTGPLKAAKTAGVPVVVANFIGPTPSAPGQGAGPFVFGLASQPDVTEGTILAEQIALNGPKNAQVGFISANIEASSPQILNALKAGLAKYCPGCKLVDTQNVNPSEWVASLGSTVSSMIISHPKMNYLIPVFDGMAPYVTAALKATHGGHSVKVITTQGSLGTAMTDVKEGKFMSDVGASSGWTGYQCVDQALRAALKLPPEINPDVPIRLVTTASLSGVNPNSDAAVYGQSYIQGFKTLWGLG